MVTQASNSHLVYQNWLLDAHFWLVVSRFPSVRNRSVVGWWSPDCGKWPSRVPCHWWRAFNHRQAGAAV